MSAETVDPEVWKKFNEIDKDGDGSITRDEFRAYFDELLKSNDELTEREKRNIADEILKQSDRDGDGSISWEEYKEMSYRINILLNRTPPPDVVSFVPELEEVEARFKTLDIDSDGFITRDQLKSYINETAKQQKETTGTGLEDEELEKFTQEFIFASAPTLDRKIPVARFQVAVRNINILLKQKSPPLEAKEMSDEIELWEQFNALDTDNGGYITEQEFVGYFEECLAQDTNLSEAERRELAEEFMRASDQDDDGYITWEEYKVLSRNMQILINQKFPPVTPEIMAIELSMLKQFNAIDNDNSGTISQEEFAAHLGECIKDRKEMSDKDIQNFAKEFMQEGDIDGDNEVSWEEFRLLMYSIRRQLEEDS